jgi:hypothetical protein
LEHVRDEPRRLRIELPKLLVAPYPQQASSRKLRSLSSAFSIALLAPGAAFGRLRARRAAVSDSIHALRAAIERPSCRQESNRPPFHPAPFAEMLVASALLTTKRPVV